jgi:hypothetical protein
MTKEEKFNKFWSLYPRKIAKVSAGRSWKRLSIKDINEIFDVYYDHLIRWKYKDIQYIPHASTWINQRRWEDELEPLQNENQSVYKNIEKQRKEFLKKMKVAGEKAASDDDRKKALGIKK